MVRLSSTLRYFYGHKILPGLSTQFDVDFNHNPVGAAIKHQPFPRTSGTGSMAKDEPRMMAGVLTAHSAPESHNHDFSPPVSMLVASPTTSLTSASPRLSGRQSEHGGGHLGGERRGQMEINRAVDVARRQTDAAGDALVKMRQAWPGTRRPSSKAWFQTRPPSGGS